MHRTSTPTGGASAAPLASSAGSFARSSAAAPDDHRPAWRPGPPPDRSPAAASSYDAGGDLAPWWVFFLMRSVPPLFHTLRSKVTLPLERVSALMQSTPFLPTVSECTSTRNTFKKIIEKQGWRSLWRGMDGELLMSVPASLVRTFFTLAFQFVPAAMIGPARLERMISAVPELFVLTVEASIVSVFYPVMQSITREQLEFTSEKGEGVVNRIRKTHEEEGQDGLYRGLVPFLGSLAIGGVTMMMLISPLRALITGTLKMPPAIGYVAFHTIATPVVCVLTYPLQTISKMQIFHPQKSIRECYDQLTSMPGGRRNLYRGFFPYCFSVYVNHITSALLYMVFARAARDVQQQLTASWADEAEQAEE